MAYELVTYSNTLASKSLVAQFTAQRVDKELKVAVERRYVENLLRKNEQLRECDPESVAIAFLDAASAGLSLSPSLGHAYLVPYGKTCSFSPGYKGIVHLFYRGGTLSRIQPGLHIEGDPKFKVWTDETGSHLVHEEAATPDRSNKKTLHSYVIAKLANGETIVTTMDREALLKVEFVATHKRERQNGKSVWVDNPRSGMVWRGSFRSQMEIKAVIRRASNYWPRDAGGHVEHAIEVMDKHDPVQFEPEPVEAEGQELLINEDQQLELHAALTDLGIESERASEWLRKKSQALGFASMDQLPQRLFETTKASLVERAKTYLKRAEELQRLESQQ